MIARRKVAYIECVIQTEVEVPIEVSTHEIVYLCLCSLVQILKLVHGLELDNIEAIR